MVIEAEFEQLLKLETELPDDLIGSGGLVENAGDKHESFTNGTMESSNTFDFSRSSSSSSLNNLEQQQQQTNSTNAALQRNQQLSQLLAKTPHSQSFPPVLPLNPSANSIPAENNSPSNPTATRQSPNPAALRQSPQLNLPRNSSNPSLHSGLQLSTNGLTHSMGNGPGSGHQFQTNFPSNNESGLQNMSVGGRMPFQLMQGGYVSNGPVGAGSSGNGPVGIFQQGQGGHGGGMVYNTVGGGGGGGPQMMSNGPMNPGGMQMRPGPGVTMNQTGAQMPVGMRPHMHPSNPSIRHPSGGGPRQMLKVS